MGPEEAIRKQGINQATLIKYPDIIGSDEDCLQHFMMITEYQFKQNIKRNLTVLMTCQSKKKY